LRAGRRISCIVVLALSAAGCRGPDHWPLGEHSRVPVEPSSELRVSTSRPPFDETSASKDLGSKAYTRIMVIPPEGSAPGKFDAYMNRIERGFMNSGIAVISSAITGRVVMEGEGLQKSETAQTLSDAERALVLAKRSNAQALLEIGSLDWTARQPCRWFLLKDDGYEEVDKHEFDSWKERKIHLETPMWVFVGRLTDVTTGEVMASFSIKYPIGWDLPSEYVAEVRYHRGRPLIRSENWTFTSGTWEAEARERVLEKTIALVAARIMGR
jgi:hypothetical protein